MSQVPPSDPLKDLLSITKQIENSPSPKASLEKPPWLSNGTYGRIYTKMCHQDEVRLAQLEKSLETLREKEKAMTGRDAQLELDMRSERDEILRRLYPGKQFLINSPSRAAQLLTEIKIIQKQMRIERLKAMGNDPLWFGPEAAGALGADDHQVTVLHKQATELAKLLNQMRQDLAARQRINENMRMHRQMQRYRGMK